MKLNASLKLKPLWTCPKCGAKFVTKNMWHSCARYSLDDLFARSEANVRKLYEKLVKIVKQVGPVIIVPQKTRIVFQVRVRFLGAMPRKKYLWVSIALPRRLKSPRFSKIVKYASNWFGHEIWITSANQFDTEFKNWIKESYKVGEQEYLKQSIIEVKLS